MPCYLDNIYIVIKKSIIFLPETYLVIRAVADASGVQRLCAEAAAEAMTMVKSASRNHLLRGKHLALTSAQIHYF
jgi:hypothetical protein